MAKLVHARSESYRTAVIDSAVCVLVSDGVGDRLLASLTRVEVITTEEQINVLPGGGFQVIPGTTPASRIQKTFEFTAEMRPDQALAVANGILDALKNLPAVRKARYGIPDNIAQIPPVPIVAAP